MAIPVYLWITDDASQEKNYFSVLFEKEKEKVEPVISAMYDIKDCYDKGKNHPDRQQVKGLGPLPQGTYRITGKTNSKGPMTIVLVQMSGETFGRNAFRIHGERVHGVPGWASEGCIIMGPSTRRRVLDSGDTTLEVVR